MPLDMPPDMSPDMSPNMSPGMSLCVFVFNRHSSFVIIHRHSSSFIIHRLFHYPPDQTEATIKRVPPPHDACTQQRLQAASVKWYLTPKCFWYLFAVPRKWLDGAGRKIARLLTAGRLVAPRPGG